MGSFSVWHGIILLVLGGIGYAVYRIIRPEPSKKLNPSAVPMGSSTAHSASHALYEIVGEELRNNSLVQALWIKSFAESNGDKNKAEAAYIRYRVAELQAAHASASSKSPPGPEGVASRPIPRWKKIGRGGGTLFVWLLVVSGVVGVLLSASAPGIDTPEAKRTAAAAAFWAVVGTGILSAIYAQKRKPMWFLIGCIGAYVGLLTISTIIRSLHGA